MQILDGKLVSAKIKQSLHEQLSALPADMRRPCLAAVLIGNNAASETYIASKIKSCAEAGFESRLMKFEENISENELIATIRQLNADPDVDGILIQLPLPAHINENKLLGEMDPSKDVDGFHPVNAGKLMQGEDTFIPATPYGIMLLMEHYKIETEGKHAVVIGRSNIVGRPMSILLSRNSYPGNCTVTLCHSKSKDLSYYCRQADIIIAAIGKPDFLKAEMVKEGAVVIDVGINRIKDEKSKTGSRLTGDVDYKEVSAKCSHITPVPGGVGPMTIAALLRNTFKAWQQKNR